jgi:hypothetical protein
METTPYQLHKRVKEPESCGYERKFLSLQGIESRPKPVAITTEVYTPVNYFSQFT